MENRSDYEKRLGEKLEAAYMLEDIGPGMSCEEFHRLIMAAEKKKKRRRSLLGLAAACVALCLVCGGFMAGMTMRGSASAGKDDETKTVQQGDSVVIGSGINEKNQNVGVSIKTYTDIEDIPEDVRKEIHFLDSDEFELEKVKVISGQKKEIVTAYYIEKNGDQLVVRTSQKTSTSEKELVVENGKSIATYKNIEIFEKENDENFMYFFNTSRLQVTINSLKKLKIEKIEAIVDGLGI